jgi:8-oxo-dGTP pyrophosphatase MutT (NUDIX family)
MDSDIEHGEELSKTGFWGKAGAGAIIFSYKTKNFLFPLRSNLVEQPNTWGVWGGAIDRGLSPEESVEKEVHEEAGYSGKMKLFPIYVFEHSSGFKYFNYIAVIEDEFVPNLNWETSDYKWVEYGNWPTPLHFGVTAILNDSKSVKFMKKIAEIE